MASGPRKRVAVVNMNGNKLAGIVILAVLALASIPTVQAGPENNLPVPVPGCNDCVPGGKLPAGPLPPTPPLPNGGDTLDRAVGLALGRANWVRDTVLDLAPCGKDCVPGGGLPLGGLPPMPPLPNGGDLRDLLPL